ncbi:MAG: cation:proton antiporter [Acholeplasmataceae bacterium]
MIFMTTGNGGYTALLFLAGMILIAYIFGKLAEKLKLPEITGFIIAGVLLNLLFITLLPAWIPGFEDSIDFHQIVLSLQPLTIIALGFVSFILGSKLFIPVVKKHVKVVLVTVLIQAILVYGLTVLLFTVAGIELWLALLIAGLSIATAAVPVIELTKKYRSKGPLTNTVFPLLAVDNITGIVVFLITAVFAIALKNNEAVVLSDFIAPLKEIGFSIGLGAIVGLLLSWLNKKYLCLYCDEEKHETYLIVTVGFVILTTILAQFIGASPFITMILVGFIFTNSLDKEDYKYETKVIEQFIPPLITGFFVIAGAELSVMNLFTYGLFALLYVVSHAGGKFLGAWLSTRITKAPEAVQKNLPTATLTQGGFEIILAMFVATRIAGSSTQEGQFILAVVLTSVLLFEFFAPLLFRRSLFKAGEAREHDVEVACEIPVPSQE